MVTAIRTGLFHPDRTRSGMLPPVGIAKGAPVTPFGRGMPPAPATPLPLHAAPLHPRMVEESGNAPENWDVAGFSTTSPTGQSFDVASPAEQGTPDSDTTEDNSVQSSSEDEEEPVVAQGRQVVFDPPSDFFINCKSLVVHCCRSPGVLKCGRRVSQNFTKVYELSGIRCSRCFDI